MSRDWREEVRALECLIQEDWRSGTYGRAYHTARIDLALAELAEVAGSWVDRDKEDPATHYYIASRLTNLARVFSAEAHALAALANAEYNRGR